jgi:hypothetical protein
MKLQTLDEFATVSALKFAKKSTQRCALQVHG